MEIVEIDDGSICDYYMTDFYKYFCLVVKVLHIAWAENFGVF